VTILLLGANLTAWVLLGFMRGGERAGHAGEGILKRKEALAKLEAEEAAVAAALAAAAVVAAAAAVEAPAAAAPKAGLV
jgi:hypothetical protein